MTDATFQWEDGGLAHCAEIKCDCGRRIEVEEMVNPHDERIIECPNCNRKYSFQWIGMRVKEEVEDER